MVKQATKEDAPVLAALAIQMRDSHTLLELEAEFVEMAANKNAQCFLIYSEERCSDKAEDGGQLLQAGNRLTPVGFAQCQLRHDYVEGTASSPVGYLEGIFVKKEYRHLGFAKELLHACEEWAKVQGCTEFASDCELDNAASFAFHMAMGFEEANRVICFRKEI